MLSRTVPEIFRWLKWSAAILTGTQAVTIAAISGIDLLRKKREYTGQGGYPIVAPEKIQVKESELTVFTDGDAVYEAMLQTINEATETIYFESFIWKSDRIGRAFKEALLAAARRGVKVYCVWDRFGNLVVRPSFFVFPRLENLYCLPYPLLHTARDHRKILVVDGKVGFVGGYNIGDTYASSKWRDTHLRITGAAVWELEAAFVDFWNLIRRWHLWLPKLPDQGAKEWETAIRAHVNSPKQLLFPVRGLYVDALNRARESAYITSAYFVPDRVIQQALIEAARRGVDVKVLVPEKSNHIVADWISRAYLSELLNNGVELWLYQDVMIHAKTAVVDGKWCTIGTANIDRLSMTGNYEINMSIMSRDMAAKMEQIFYMDLTNSREMTRHEWNQRRNWKRAVEQILKPLAFFV